MNIIIRFWKWWYEQHKTPSRITKEEALKIACRHNLEKEVNMAMENGCNPDEALKDWDL